MAQIAIGEAFESAIQTMSEYVSEVQKEVSEVFEEFRQMSVIENPWEVLYRTAATLESMYNEQVLGAIKSAVNDWAEGEGSYVSLTVRFRMGDEAKTEAERQQSQIVEEITSIPEFSIISEAQPNFLNTKFELEAVKAKLEEISYQAKKLTNVSEEKNSQLSDLSEENESVRTIVNVGITYGASIANFVAKVTERISAFLSEQLTSMEQLNEAAVEEAKQSAEKFSQFIEDTIASMDKEFEDLFG